ncbi:MAG: tandem-95 repeat protein [Blastocatellales bacterium]
MVSLRAGQTLVRLIRVSANAWYRYWLGLALAAAVTAGAGVTLARRLDASEKSRSRQLPSIVLTGIPVVPPASFIHFVKAIIPSALGDLSSTTVTSVPAASFESVPVAPESIVAAFGVQLANQTVIATDADPNTPGIQLPAQLGGTTVEVKGRRAGLFFVSPGQVNYLMPDATETGIADVVIKSGDGTTSTGTVQIAQVSPAIFAANANGIGVPAANLLRLKANGQQSYESLSQLNAAGDHFVTKPIDMGPDGERVFLILYLSGVHRATAGSIRVLIGGIEATPLFSGPAPGFVGLDQINVEIPRDPNLIGRGVVNVSVTAAGYTASNLVDIEMAGNGGPSPPQVSGFGAPEALAGQAMIINGSGFSPVAAENIVRIAGLDAEVMQATQTSLTVMVPFGVETGTVRVITPMGEGISASMLPVRTSISGLVENTSREPLAGVSVKVSNLTVEATTDNEGHFVLPGIDAGVYEVNVDGGAINASPPYPKVSLKITAQSSRDNAFSRAIALQQATGSGGTVGSGSSFGGDGVDGSSVAKKKLDPQPVSIQTDDFTLEIQGSTKAKFPDNSTSGEIFLTPLMDARTPVELPFGYFSSSIVQITPFGVELDPGAKLIFPNKDGLPPGSPAILFRYDQKEGKFVQDPARVTVSADGKWIETAQDAIKITTYYFAAVRRDTTTTITGRVVEKDGKTPIIRALARFRGQEALTDGAGSYVLRFVAVKDGEEVSVEVSTVRPNGRVDRAQSEKARAVLGGTTKVLDVRMPGTTENRRPTIIGPKRLEIEEGKTRNERLIVTDPDAGQTIDVKVEGAPFAAVTRGGLTTATSAWTLRLSPGYSQSGRYKLLLTATDGAGGSDTQEIDLTVKNVNRAPVANNQVVVVEEDTPLAIKLEGSDLDGDRLSYVIVGQPANGKVSGSGQNVTYTPNLNFTGADRFTFKVNDGDKDSGAATVTVTVKPVNDPPSLTVPGAQSASEGQTLNFAVSASDPDAGQKLIITAQNLPVGATLTSVTGTSVQFNWTPGFAQAGIYKVTFNVVDDATPSLSDTKDVQVTVSDVALFTAPTPKRVSEGQLLAFDIEATPGLPSPVNLSVTDMPAGALFQNPSANTLQFRWIPGSTQAGNYMISIKATIGLQPPVSEIRQMQITVFDGQHDFAEDTSDLTVIGVTDAAPPLPGSRAGASVAFGDLDGDGVDDLVIGAPTDNGRGEVHILFGRGNPKGTIDLAKRAADVTIRGESLDDLFGSSLAIGDVNADGKADLIIGVPTADASPNAPDSGKVYAVFGGLTPGAYDIAKIANLTILGAARGDRLGASVAVGKIHGAASPAGLIIGAPFCDASVATATLPDAGCVYGFLGDAALTGVKDLGSSSADFTIAGIVPNGQFGASLATGNFDGGDLADIAIGAPNADFGLLNTVGVVYLVPGSQSLKGAINVLQAAPLMLNGADAGDAIGSSLAMGDVNGDGRADLIIGAPNADGPNNSRLGSGEVYIVFGATAILGRPAQMTIFGGSDNSDDFPDGLGSSLAVGDFTGDGAPDLIMGAPGGDPVNPARQPAGAAYMIFGGRNFKAGTFDLASKAPDLKIFGAKSGDRLGNGGFAFGKLDSSGANELAIGIPGASKAGNGASGAGEVRVLFGVIR